MRQNPPPVFQLAFLTLGTVAAFQGEVGKGANAEDIQLIIHKAVWGFMSLTNGAMHGNVPPELLRLAAVGACSSPSASASSLLGGGAPSSKLQALKRVPHRSANWSAPLII